MKKLILTGIGFFLAVGLTFAQQTDKKNPEQTATEVVNALSEQLSFTDEQKATAFTITLEEAKQASALLADSSVSDADLLAQLNALQAQSDEKIAALLTEEQQEIFKKIVSERPAKVVPQREQAEDESGN